MLKFIIYFICVLYFVRFKSLEHFHFSFSLCIQAKRTCPRKPAKKTIDNFSMSRGSTPSSSSKITNFFSTRSPPSPLEAPTQTKRFRSTMGEQINLEDFRSLSTDEKLCKMFETSLAIKARVAVVE